MTLEALENDTDSAVDPLAIDGALAALLSDGHDRHALPRVRLLYSPEARRQNERGTRLARKGKLREAIKAFSVAISHDPAFAAAWNNRGFARWQLGDLIDAEQDLKTARQCDPRLMLAHHNLGLLYATRGQFAEAVSCYSSALRINPHFASGLQNRAVARIALGDFDDAIRDLDSALQLSPRNAVAFYNRGFARLSQGRYDAAEADFDCALELAGHFTAGYFHRGELHRARRRFDRAIADYSLAIKHNRKLVQAYYHRAEALHETGDFQGAIRDFTEVIRQSPKRAAAFNNRGLSYRALGQETRALADFVEAIRLAPDYAAPLAKSFTQTYRSVVRSLETRMSLAIAICATKNFTYAMCEQLRRVVANLRDEPPGHVILSGDSSAELKAVIAEYQRLMPDGWRVHHIENRLAEDNNPHYQQAAQLLLMQLRSEAFSCARRLNADWCWSLDSDVLPPPNALRCMKNMLQFDDGYYSVSTCPYPNSLFLGGRGTPQNPIAEDFLPNERKLPDDLKAEWEAFQEKVRAAPQDQIQKLWDGDGAAIQKRIRECSPDGNIWEVTSKHGWRRRGWLDFAYPALGKGAVVPSDWCGFGCTLLNRRALDVAHFDTYDGKGTEDLYIVWKRWFPAGLRINVITHCPCDL